MSTSALDRSRFTHTVLECRRLTAFTFVLRFERKGLTFKPGQYISVGLADDLNMREYSVYSSVDSPYLEILVREVEGGAVSHRLGGLVPGDRVYVEGPFGFFTMDEATQRGPLLFIASGTGISPFHCFAQSYPQLRYTLLHGVRTLEERYEFESFPSNSYISCVSREKGGDFNGRVTDWLRSTSVDPATKVYLCGNCDMIYEVYDILASKGHNAADMFAEVYF